MYLSISQEVTRRHSEEIMQTIAEARMSETPANHEAPRALVRNHRWELSRYAGILGKRLRWLK